MSKFLNVTAEVTVGEAVQRLVQAEVVTDDYDTKGRRVTEVHKYGAKVFTYRGNSKYPTAEECYADYWDAAQIMANQTKTPEQRRLENLARVANQENIEGYKRQPSQDVFRLGLVDLGLDDYLSVGLI